MLTTLVLGITGAFAKDVIKMTGPALYSYVKEHIINKEPELRNKKFHIVDQETKKIMSIEQFATDL